MSKQLGVLVAIALAGCVGKGVNSAEVYPPTPAASDYAAAGVGTLLPAGTLVGLVERYAPAGFTPAPGVTVTLTPGNQQAVTDLQGHYRFKAIAPGTLTLSVQATGSLSAQVQAHMGEASGLPRVNLPLVPTSSTLGVAGVLSDPRGAALPGGSVHVVDSFTSPGNRTVTADADGFFAVALGGTAGISDQILVQGYGTTPGGLHVESTTVTALPAQGMAAVQVATNAFLAPAGGQVVQSGGGKLVLKADNLPTRLDELTLAITAGPSHWAIAPDSIAAGQLSATLPAGLSGAAKVTLRPFDQDPPSGAVALDFTAGP